ncbi:MAG: cobalamin transport system ATP-binding protein [Methanothermococcus sp.]|jgi:iron complex transport system ATP-binding protein|uniref:ABC transporter ATP-binding protein n=1 Tax=Methanothermococcus TaxID=155862 RepID=UPI00035C2E9D|nr:MULTISPECIES: ABC transporter ATP-binding protein [Methanothermococcus]MDK2790015.1 cobalamin transport system ATP-binding protein [Methanothermococcus sp.]MDK2986918.1 cobalamin transport system ATP-binding protein [Methanothermococcus sp.]
MLKTENLTVGYKNYIVVEDVNLHIKEREILCIIGPNGAGKSTLLKTIATYLKPKKGVVYLNGQNIHSLTPKKLAKEMAVVLTERVNPGNMTGYDIIAIGRHPYTDLFGRLTEKDKEIITHAAKSVNAEYLLNKNFFEMSDGERQKIMIARALAQKPNALILDEPTSFLDAKHKIELTLLLRKLATENNLAIIVTLHDIELALRIADKMALIKNHRVIAYGHPEDVMKKEIVNNLYDLDNANYNEIIGYFELKNANSGFGGYNRIFLVCGAGTGVDVLRFLTKNGYDVVVGILHKNDIDYIVAKTMELEIICEEPYEPISNEKFEKALHELRTSDVVIYTDFPVGQTNILNKKLVEHAINTNKKVIKYDGNIKSLKEMLE